MTNIVNTKSDLLTDIENENVFKMLGEKCQTLATTVVQLLVALPESRTRWSKQTTGVACFVKDNSKRSYFIRIYDLSRSSPGLAWEQELYNQFKYKAVRPFFHTFAADSFNAGLNFANEYEARHFQQQVEIKLKAKQQRKQERRKQSKHRRGPPPALESSVETKSRTDGGMVHSPSQTSLTSISSNKSSKATSKEKNGKKKGKGRPKLSKKDIGKPENFQHVGHIGWDPQGGFGVNNVDMDENWKKLFSMIGVTEGQMQEKKTREFIYDFVQEQGVIEAVTKQIEKMEDSAVPEEIISRGPETEKVYRQALEHGEVEVYRGRIMIIGQDGAGKTSLKKSLLGLPFDPKEQSTVGVVVDPSSFSVDVDDAVEWQKSDSGDVNNNSFEDGVASVMAELLNEQVNDRRLPFNPETKEEPEEQNETTNVAEKQIGKTPKAIDTLAPLVIDNIEDVDDSPDIPHHVVETGQEIFEDSEENSKEHTNQAENATEKDIVPEMVIENLIQRLKAKRRLGSSIDQEITVSIWDFAGQELYYASHPVFFSHRAVYILVYNLQKDLLAEAEPCVRQGVHEIRLDNHDHQTNLDALLSWLVSIHSAWPKASHEVETKKKLPYLRPPVVIVGSHADHPFEEPKKMEEIIQKTLSRKSYDKHVVRPIIAVDNTMSSRDDGVNTLKEKVKQLLGMEPYMGEKVPVRWFEFEKVIKSLVNDHKKNFMSLEDLESIILQVCHIKDKKEISALLNYYHDLGVIVKHGNTVVLESEWLIKLFRKLICIRPRNEQDPVNSEYWRTLQKTGKLDMKLVEHVFKEQIYSGETKDDILAMMEHYGLIARFGDNDVAPKSFHYFVPAQLNSSPEAFSDVGPSMSDPCPLYVHFVDGFIPHGLYHCLVSRLISWCSSKGYPHEPNLYQSVSRFFIGRAYRYELFLKRRKRFVKVVLRSLQTERSWVFQPIPFQIREFLEDSLKELTEECPWYQSLNYEMCVRCPSIHVTKCEGHQQELCIDEECLHLLPVDGDLELVCRESIGEESKPYVLGLQEWYREHPIVPEHSEEERTSCLSVPTTFKLGDGQKRWLVIGICLNKILLPALRSFTETKMLSLYSHLKTTHNIDTQVYSGHLTKEGKCNSLNYGSINSNQAIHKKKVLYDYNVNSAVDLAKLYLQPFMAKFSGFDDTCDLSATLGILSSASAFCADVQDLSGQVRIDVRNEWGHCNFTVWDEAKFATCFKLMDSLVKALGLKAEEEKRVTDELGEWEDKGVKLCMNTISNEDLLKFIEHSDAVLDRLTREVKHLESRQEGEIRRLQSVRSHFEKFKDSINKNIERIQQKLESHERKINFLMKSQPTNRPTNQTSN